MSTHWTIVYEHRDGFKSDTAHRFAPTYLVEMEVTEESKRTVALNTMYVVYGAVPGLKPLEVVWPHAETLEEVVERANRLFV